ncbi:MAG: Gfo/Idh/MocA family oxidoreductase [Thermomicrobiales bacterium]
MDVSSAGEKLRVGIVGAGAWARLAHVPGFQRCPDVDLVAICDPDLGRAEVVAAEAGIPRVFPSIAAMTSETDLDLVSIVTPDDSHPADVRVALGMGAHILCEKPLATTVRDARDLAGLADATGVHTRVGFVMRFAPAVARLRERVVSGEMGEIQHLQAFQQNGQFLDPAVPFHWKMDRARTGGGAVVEYGIHTIDLALWIMGAASSVCAGSRTWVRERALPDGSGTRRVESDDATAWLMEFASGASGVCHASWSIAGRAPGLEIRVFGSRGAARCLLSDDLPGAQGLWVAGPDGHFRDVGIEASAADNGGPAAPWWVDFSSRLISDFVAEVRGAPGSGPTFGDGVAAQEVLEAILRSTQQRRWVDLPLP